MNGSVMNRSVMNVVCYEWSVMSRSLMNGHLKGLFYSGNEVQRRQPTDIQGTCCDRRRSV